MHLDSTYLKFLSGKSSLSKASNHTQQPIFWICTMQLAFCPITTPPSQTTFVIIILIQIQWHENKNEADSIPEDMGCYLSIDHNISLPIWRAIVRYTIISADIPVNHFISAVDGIYRSPFCRIADPQILQRT